MALGMVAVDTKGREKLYASLRKESLRYNGKKGSQSVYTFETTSCLMQIRHRVPLYFISSIHCECAILT